MCKSTGNLAALVAALTVSFGIAACSGGQHAGAQGAGEPMAAGETTAQSVTAGEAGEHAGVAESGEHEAVGGDREHREGEEHARREAGEHEGAAAGEHGEAGHDEAGEESGVYIGRAETWDATRKGARLVMSFDPTSNVFVGSVKNTTTATLCAVRVEVHLSTGTELGPTPQTDIPAGQTARVELPTSGEAFESWTAHPEVSACSGG